MNSILLLETTTLTCQIGLHYRGAYIEKTCEGFRKHSRDLLPLIDAVLHQAEISLADLDYIAFTIGPGSFTGMRLGLACVQAIHLVHHTKLVPLSTFAALAASVLINTSFKETVICQDAKMGEVSIGRYQKQGKQIVAIESEYMCSPDKVQLEDNLEAKYLVGDGWQLLKVSKDLNIDTAANIQLTAMHALALQAIANSEVYSSVQDVHLNYLRDERAWKKLN